MSNSLTTEQLEHSHIKEQLGNLQQQLFAHLQGEKSVAHEVARVVERLERQCEELKTIKRILMFILVGGGAGATSYMQLTGGS